MAIINGRLGGKGPHTNYMIRHLTRLDENDRVEILEIDQSLPSATVEAALKEWQLLAETNTKSKKGFYASDINIREDEELTVERWIKAADILEKRLGFQGQPRLIVQHEKKGREHIHVLWQSTIVDECKLVSDSHNYRKHVEAAIEIEKEFGLAPTRRKGGPEIKQDREEDSEQEEKVLSLLERREMFRKLYERAESGGELVQALEQEGYYLARGDRSLGRFMLVDPQFQAEPLSKYTKGIRMAEIKAFLDPIEPSSLAPASEVIRALRNPEHALDQKYEIEATYQQERQELSDRHKQEKTELLEVHDDFNEFIKLERLDKEPTGVFKLIQDWSGYTWYKHHVQEREDRERLAAQKIERDQLDLNQKKELEALEDRKTREISRLNDVYRESAEQRPRFFVNINRRMLNEVNEKLDAVFEYDQKDMRLQDVEERLSNPKLSAIRPEIYEALERQKAKLLENVTEEKLGLMRILHRETISLEKEVWAGLTPEGQVEIKRCRELFKDEEKRREGDEAIKKYFLDLQEEERRRREREITRDR